MEDDVIKAFEFPGEEFSTKEQLFKHLKKHETKIISLKKAAIKNSEGANYPLTTKSNEAIKGIGGLKDGFIYPVINTTNYMDTHNDVHLPKIWNKSIKEQKGKTFYVTDHDLKINSVIAYPKDVAVSVRLLHWSDLGKTYAGETQALMFEVSKDNLKHEGAINIVEEKIDIDHSVRMQYVDLFLAIDSDAKEDKEYKKRFDKHIDSIANKDSVIEQGYFWGIKEAKIVKEGSMVLLGSNDITPLLQGDDNTESAKVTPDKPPKGTEKVARSNVRW